MTHRVAVIVPTPAHSSLVEPLSYRSELPLAPGSLVRVPLGKREVAGVVWDLAAGAGDIPAGLTEKTISARLDELPPLSAGWQQLVTFSAQYYQRSLGEVALAALPPQLRELDPLQLARRLKRLAPAAPQSVPADGPPLTAQQAAALHRIATDPGPFLLFGATGSGKTEVYLQAVQSLLAREPQIGRAHV